MASFTTAFDWPESFLYLRSGMLVCGGDTLISISIWTNAMTWKNIFNFRSFHLSNNNIIEQGRLEFLRFYFVFLGLVVSSQKFWHFYCKPDLYLVDDKILIKLELMEIVDCCGEVAYHLVYVSFRMLNSRGRTSNRGNKFNAYRLLYIHDSSHA